jgi:hypothetical protein
MTAYWPLRSAGSDPPTTAKWRPAVVGVKSRLESSIDASGWGNPLDGQHQPIPGAPVDPDDAGNFGHVISELRSNISNLLVKSRGAVAHRALVQLMETETEINAKQWLAAQVTEHAAIEASLSSMIEPRALCNLASPFASSPRSAAQLFAV